MGRTKAPAWGEYTEPTEKESVKSGLTVIVHGWKCRFCGSSFWNTNLERMLGHVSCDRALCKAIDPCSAAKVPEEQRLEAKAQLDARNGVASGKKKRAAQADETAEDDATHRASHQAKLRNKQESKCKVDSALSDMFDGLGIAHSKVDHPLVKRFVESVKNSPSDWKLPSSKTLGGNLLDSEHKVNLDERNELLRHDGVRSLE